MSITQLSVRAPADLSAIKLVSFDLDDTFWDCLPAIERAEQALLEWHRQHTPRITQAHDATSLLDYRNQIRVRHPHLTGCVTSLRKAGLKSLLADFDYPESLAEQAFDLFYQKRSELTLYAGVHELLSECQKHFSVAAITNGNADLQRIGIARYFDIVLAADLQLSAKPAPHMFQMAVAHFGLSAHQALHVGDNPSTDVQGAVQAGMQALWFNQHEISWPLADPGAHFEVQSLADIQSLLFGPQ